MKRLTALVLSLVMLSSAIQTFAAGDASVPEPLSAEAVTDALFEQRVSGNVYMSTNSPRVRIGTRIEYIDPDDLTVKPMLVGSTLMLPAEFLADSLSAEYAGDLTRASFSLHGKSVSLTLGQNDYTANGEAKQLADAPCELSGRLWVPLRAVCEALGKEVAWDKCGIVIAGDSAKSFDWNDKTSYEILLRASRDIIYENPTPEDVVALLKQNNPDNRHPRLLLDSDKVEELKYKVHNVEPYKSWFESELHMANVYLGYDDAKLNIDYVLEDGQRLLAVSRRAAGYIEKLSFAYLMTGNEDYSDKAIDVLMKVCGEDFPDWHPWHFLDVAEMAAAVALGYDWLYDMLRPSQKWIIKNALVEKALKPVMEDYNEVPGRSRSWYWSSKSADAYPQNWISVCFGGTVMAALAVGDEDLGDFTEVGKVITEGMDRQKDLNDTYMPDGAFIDGTGYWELAMQYYAYAIASMQSALGTDYSMLNCPGIDSTFEWLAQLMGPDGGYNFESNNPSYTNSPEYFWYSAASGNSQLSDYRLEKHLDEWKLNPSWKDIVWYEASSDGASHKFPLTYSSRGGLGITTLRTGYNDMDSWIAMLGGAMDKAAESVQNENGSFVLDMLGTRWALDLGSEAATYGSSGTDRKDYYRERAEGNNTVIIQPGYDFDHNPYVHGTQECFDSNANGAYIIYDFTNQLAYKGATSWKRGISLDNHTNRVTLQDELSASKPIEYYWFMHTDAQVEISSDGKSAILSKDNRQIMAKLTSDDASLKFEVMSAEPLATSPNPSHQQVNDGIRKLTVHSVNDEIVNMAVEFIPLFGSETDVPLSAYTALGEWTLPKTAALDNSLTISSLAIGGENVDGFSPTRKYYSKELGLSGAGAPPEISAVSEAGDVSIIAPTEENYVGKITVSAPDGRKNEYYVDFYTKDFSDSLITIDKLPIVAYGVEQKGYTRYEVAKITATDVPQAENGPENMFDGKLSTRYSTNVLGATVDFDLGESRTVNRIGTAISDGTERGMMYVLASSDDGINWKEVVSVKTSGTTDDVEVYDIPETTARYFRMYCCGNTVSGSVDGSWFSITELAFYGK